MSKKKKSGLLSTNATVADNKRARFDYALEDKFEAGMMLHGTEVKSLRHGQANIKEAYVGPKNGEIWLFNANIPEYQQASQALQHEPKRPRKLLLHKREVDKLLGAVSREGYAIVPLRLYFNARGMAKIEIALAKGKRQYDKRETEKKRDWDKQKGRIMREKG
ncbi:MAG TPA: SsrA-binding protein SmpB [Alphaproteobacteria bacterium]|nr:SsrA-binding protein SmpB [Alphaproteobacteria bacterium]USO06619.1 MAG: SsrA-binding protein SmpB [Rhodospirillales bacterium]HOO80956.1 SsrA-binding protein SmpB [Alphaproteobacteria bacterium]